MWQREVQSSQHLFWCQAHPTYLWFEEHWRWRNLLARLFQFCPLYTVSLVFFRTLPEPSSHFIYVRSPEERILLQSPKLFFFRLSWNFFLHVLYPYHSETAIKKSCLSSTLWALDVVNGFESFSFFLYFMMILDFEKKNIFPLDSQNFHFHKKFRVWFGSNLAFDLV